MSLLRLVTANHQLKLLSLLLATVIWMFVTLEAVDETELPLVVHLVNVRPGMALSEKKISGCRLRIKGPLILLLRQRWLGAAVGIDLATASAGKLTIDDLDRRVRLIPGVSLLAVCPASLEILLDKAKS